MIIPNIALHGGSRLRQHGVLFLKIGFHAQGPPCSQSVILILSKRAGRVKA